MGGDLIEGRYLSEGVCIIRPNLQLTSPVDGSSSARAVSAECVNARIKLGL